MDDQPPREERDKIARRIAQYLAKANIYSRPCMDYPALKLAIVNAILPAQIKKVVNECWMMILPFLEPLYHKVGSNVYRTKDQKDNDVRMIDRMELHFCEDMIKKGTPELLEVAKILGHPVGHREGGLYTELVLMLQHLHMQDHPKEPGKPPA